MTRLFVQPLSVTQKARGIYYCYTNQAWIEDGIVTRCGHPDDMRPGCCYAGEHEGEEHGACDGCR